MMKRTRYFSVVFATLLPIMILSVMESGCGKKDDDEIKPIVSAVPTPPPTPSPAPTPAAIVPEEDAGSDAAVDAGSDAKPVLGTGGGASATIAKCCAALQGNANSAPPEQKGAYLAAASACQGLKGMPVAQQAFAQIRTFLAGAKMPGACQ